MRHTGMTKLEGCERIDDVMEKLNAKFNAEKREVFNADYAVIPGVSEVVRSDTKAHFGMVSSRYGLIQYSDAFAFFDALVESRDATYTSGATVNNGAIMIVQAKINGTTEVRRGDGVESYITLSAGHDGKHPVKAWFNNMRLFCTNQISRTLRSVANGVTIRHTSNASARMSEALNVLGLAKQYNERFFEVCRRLAEATLTSSMVDDLILSVCGESERKDAIERRTVMSSLIYAGAGNNGESVWDAYNGVAEYADWHRFTEDSDRRLVSSLFEDGMKTAAWNWALRTAEVQ